jgi:hypothetical protein
VSRLQGLLRSTKRHRTSSSGSEPELVPVVKKYRRGSHYSAPGGKVRGGRGGPRGNCYMTPTLPIQHPQPNQPYPQCYQAFPPTPSRSWSAAILVWLLPPTTYIYVPTSLTCWSCS